jgi:hypothetical protein
MVNVFPGFRTLDKRTTEIIPATDEDLAVKPKTAKEVFDLYKRLLTPSELSLMTSTLTKYVVPSLAGPAIKGKRASEKEIEAALKYLESVSPTQLPDALKQLEQYFDKKKIKTQERRKPRHYLKKFVDYAISENFIEVPEEEPITFYRLNEVQKSRVHVGDVKLMEGRPSWVDRNRLGVFDEDFVVVSPAQKPDIPFIWYPGFVHSPQLLGAIYWVEIAAIMPKIYLANEELEHQLIAFGEFLLNSLHMRMPTVIRDMETILRYLGWLHRQQGIPLEQLSLNCVITFTPLKLSLPASQFRDDYNKYLVEKAIAREDAEEVAKTVKEDVERFLASCKVSCASEINYVKSFVSLGKYLYHKETKQFKLKRGFEDVPVIESLRQIQRESEHARRDNPRTVMEKNKRMIPWPTLLWVVEMHRIEFELTHRSHVRHTRPRQDGSKRIEKTERTSFVRARQLQHFLILALLTAMPPSRARVMYELEMGRTLKRGYKENGVFIENANSPKSEWWLFLKPQDNKTRKEWSCKIPNPVYGNGKSLYDYLQDWWEVWRPVLTPQHNCLFSCTATDALGKSLNSASYGSVVTHAINRFTGVPVNPHSIRSMFVTYLKDNRATDAELDSAAKFMRHSRQTQEEIYNQQTLHKELELSGLITKRLVESASEKFEQSSILLHQNQDTTPVLASIGTEDPEIQAILDSLSDEGKAKLRAALLG